MKKDSKQRLFEVMGRLDKTFKPNLNEEFGISTPELPATGEEEMPVDGAEEMPVEEKSPEEKLQELTAKVDEIYGMLHNEESEEEIELPTEPEAGEAGVEIEMENLQEWNFDKKKGEKEDDKKEDVEGDDKTPAEDKEEELDEAEEPAKKVPVEAIAKIGK